MASQNGLAGTVAKLLSHGANAGLADKVRTYMRADVMIHTSSILLDDLPCRAFHLYAALHCCGVTNMSM